MAGLDRHDEYRRAIAQVIVKGVFALRKWHVATSCNLEVTVAMNVSLIQPLHARCAGIELLHGRVDGVFHRYFVDAEA